MAHRSQWSALGFTLVACGGMAVGPQDGGGGGADDAANGGSSSAKIHLVRSDDTLCLPQALPVDASGASRCRILVALPAPNPESACSAFPGLSVPDAETIATFRDAERIDSSLPICVLAQLGPSASVNGTCEGSSEPGWCYVTEPASGKSCPQALRVSAPGHPPAGALVALACP